MWARNSFPISSNAVESITILLNDPIKKNKLKTFDSLIKSKISDVKVKNRTVTIKADGRGVNLKEALSDELAAVPLSLSNVYGSLATTSKANFFKHRNNGTLK